MRVATWNLDHASNGSRPVALQIQQILHISPDILVLTETCDQVDLTPYGYTPTQTERNSYAKYCSVIWTKFPIARSVPTYDPKTAVCAEISTPFGSVIVYGTIITYFGDTGPDGTSPYWHEHHKEIGAQGDDWNKIYRNFYGYLPLLVAGDFNQPRDGSKYNRSKGGLNIKLLDEQLDRNGLECLTTEDFAVAGKVGIDPVKGYARNNIDHICATSGAFVVESVGAWDHFTKDNVFMSDHNGVYVDLTLS
jgi:hypothetical protein